jgi:hypothetical protein
MTATTIDALSNDVRNCKNLLIGLERSDRARRRADEQQLLELLPRALGALLTSKVKNVSLEDAIAQRCGDERSRIVVRAAVAPAMVGVPEWAGSFVGETVLPFLSGAIQPSAFAQLAAKCLSVTFDKTGAIKVPVRANTGILGSWVAEGNAIRVIAATLAAINLAPKKLGSISVYSRELAFRSPQSVEAVMRQIQAEDLGTLLDQSLLSDAAGDATQPPGIFFGNVPLPASTATTPQAAMLEDLQALAGALPPGARVAYLVNREQALSQAVLLATPLRDVIVSQWIDAGQVAAVDLASLVLATGAVQFEIAPDTTLHMEGETPLPFSASGAPNLVAAPIMSTFQVAAVGIRALLETSWGLRANAVARIDGVSW